MTTPEPMDGESLKLFGAIVSANAAASHAASDRVIENLEHEVKLWQKRFADMWRAVDLANEKVDSLRVEKILARNSQYARVG